MIGPGSMPRLWTLGRKRTLAYTRAIRRRTKRRAGPPRPAAIRHDQSVIFDQGPWELPTATVVARQPTARAILGALHAWLGARWQWFAPRAVPVLVATVGMILVLASADYLAHSHFEPAPNWSMHVTGP